MSNFILFLQFLMKKIYYMIIANDYIINIFLNCQWDYVSNLVYMIFFIIIIFSNLGVLLSKNPIHSLFFLIVIFLHVSLLLLLLHVEFIAFLILIVYLGAIAVLFLFVIMMFNIHILESRDNIIRYIPLIILIFLIFIEISYISNWMDFTINTLSITDIHYLHRNWYDLWSSKDNINVLTIIYNYYFYNFIIAGLILLVAMIGAIILTLNQNLDLKKQKYYEQNRKHLYNSLSLKKTGKFRKEVWQIFFRKKKGEK